MNPSNQSLKVKHIISKPASHEHTDICLSDVLNSNKIHVNNVSERLLQLTQYESNIDRSRHLASWGNQ